MCKYCNPDEWYEECFEYKEWTGIKLINLTDDDVIIQASGSGLASYRPKYCPECGRKLNFEKMNKPMEDSGGDMSLSERQKKIFAFPYSRYEYALSKAPREETERMQNGELSE